MGYIVNFLERNRQKSFVNNLIKYSELEFSGKAKVISSFLTHLLIDQEQGEDNNKYIIDVLSLLNKYILYKQDEFFDWLKNNSI